MLKMSIIKTVYFLVVFIDSLLAADDLSLLH